MKKIEWTDSQYFMNWLYAEGTRCLFSGAVTENNTTSIHSFIHFF